MGVLEHWSKLKKNIEHCSESRGRDFKTIELMVVSKGQPSETIKLLAQAGQRYFGESYIQEAIPKIQALSDLNLDWHFIGPIQSNKIKGVVRHFSTVHSLDRLAIADRLNQQSALEHKILKVLVQVNVSQEIQKSGIQSEQVLSFVEKLQDYPHLSFQGLMGMGPASRKIGETERAFDELARLALEIKAQGIAAPHLSMGMSHDYDIAISKGATWLRIGSAIFKHD